MTGQVYHEANDPCHTTHEYGRSAGVDLGVAGVVTDVHVAVDSDATDTEHRHDARYDTDAAERDAHVWLAIVEVCALHHACVNISIQLK